MKGRSPLGKGLGALIPRKHKSGEVTNDIARLPLEQIRVNPRQPRSHFHTEALAELVASIREHGILQPLVVMPKGEGYELIAGERRFQSAKKLGFKTVPVVIRNATEQQQLELALVENLQRKNLNPLEEAVAFDKLMDEFHLTQAEIAERVGKSRSHIANILRILTLPEPVKRAILDERITEGHAKALLSLPTERDQVQLLQRMLATGMSVRTGEAIARGRKPGKKRATGDPEWRSLEEDLQRALGTKVQVRKEGGRGTITIEFYSREELEALIERLTHP